MRPLLALLPCLLCSAALAQSLPAPSHTAPLDWPDDPAALSVRMVAGIDQWLMRATEQSISKRAQYWHRDLTSPETYAKSIEPNREHLKQILGIVDPLVNHITFERFINEPKFMIVGTTSKFVVWQVRWPVLDGIWGEGLLLESANGGGAEQSIIVPDADQTPEMLAGLLPGLPPDQQLARLKADKGARVLVMTTISRGCEFSGDPRVAMTNQPHREWIYRMAFELGRHPIGYEVQQVLAACHALLKDSTPDESGETTVAVDGIGEGGIVAMAAAAIDPRIKSCTVHGQFGPRNRLWEEPIYRNVFGLLREFGDAEIAGLIGKHFSVVPSPGPQIEGPPVAPKGTRQTASPGKLATPPFEKVRAELDRFIAMMPAGFKPLHPLKSYDAQNHEDPKEQIINLRQNFDPLARQKRVVKQIEDHLQTMLRRSMYDRDAFFWNKVDRKSVEGYAKSAEPFRGKLWREHLGKIDDALLPMKALSRKRLETDQWIGYDVVMDVWPDVFAWGVLLLPKDLKPGERRPVVVTQHGLEGLPDDTITTEGRAGQAYGSFSAKLAERGFIVFAPHNPYRGQDAFRVLVRKANPLGLTLWSFILGQHEQILNWLQSQPFVDPERIGFYGLSYGGKSAMRIPACLERYCLSICSGDFNEWVWKCATVDWRNSYMYTGEYEMYEWDLGHTFNYAEMAGLIFPRPFMVERGHRDGVGVDEMVNLEYSRVRRLYNQMGLGDKTEIEHFNGPHMIHGAGTYEFLHKHLNWPKK